MPSLAVARRRGELGQASVELVAVLPAAALVALLAWQLALAGQALWATANAARVAARAHAVGRSPAAAARSALPRSLRAGLHAQHGGAGVRVRTRLPLLFPGAHRSTGVSASAALAPPRGVTPMAIRPLGRRPASRP